MSTPLRNLKSDKNSFSYFVGENEHRAHISYSCFLRDLYRTNGTTIVVLTMHSNLSYNDDCP